MPTIPAHCSSVRGIGAHRAPSPSLLSRVIESHKWCSFPSYGQRSSWSTSSPDQHQGVAGGSAQRERANQLGELGLTIDAHPTRNEQQAETDRSFTEKGVNRQPPAASPGR